MASRITPTQKYINTVITAAEQQIAAWISTCRRRLSLAEGVWFISCMCIQGTRLVCWVLRNLCDVSPDQIFIGGCCWIVHRHDLQLITKRYDQDLRLTPIARRVYMQAEISFIIQYHNYYNTCQERKLLSFVKERKRRLRTVMSHSEQGKHRTLCK